MNRPAKKTLNFLHFTCKYSCKVGRRIIWDYAKTHGINKGGEENFIEAGNCIQRDWDSFMKWLNVQPKGTYLKGKSIKNKYHDSHIKEALQYTNGCADDF